MSFISAHIIGNLQRYDDLVDAINRKDAELTALVIAGIIEDNTNPGDEPEFIEAVQEELSNHY